MTVTIVVTGNAQEALRRLQERIIAFNAEAKEQSIEEVIDVVGKPGEKPEYPIKWDSVKQRKAFFATHGFGGGIPYKRTGAYVNAFAASDVDDSAWRLTNDNPYARYVGGDSDGNRYSRIHLGRWPLVRAVVNYVVNKFVEELERKIVSEIADL